MASAEPKVILWDLMDTLVRDPFFVHMPSFFGLSFQELLAQKHPTAWRDFELSVIDEAELFARFFRDGRAIDGEGLKRRMRDAYVFIDGIEALLAELQQRGVPMHLLSNYPSWVSLCDERVGFTRYVAPSFVSCHTGVRKPDAEAFLGACRQLGVSPEACLFVDDRAVNCDAAHALGLHVHHFCGDVPALRGALARLGFLSAS